VPGISRHMIGESRPPVALAQLAAKLLAVEGLAFVECPRLPPMKPDEDLAGGSVGRNQGDGQNLRCAIRDAENEPDIFKADVVRGIEVQRDRTSSVVGNRKIARVMA